MGFFLASITRDHVSDGENMGYRRCSNGNSPKIPFLKRLHPLRLRKEGLHGNQVGVGDLHFPLGLTE